MFATDNTGCEYLFQGPSIRKSALQTAKFLALFVLPLIAYNLLPTTNRQPPLLRSEIELTLPLLSQP